jgi:hypothetical protein
MARRSEMGDLGLSESTTTNTEIAIKYQKKFCHLVSWQNFPNRFVATFGRSLDLKS